MNDGNSSERKTGADGKGNGSDGREGAREGSDEKTPEGDRIGGGENTLGRGGREKGWGQQMKTLQITALALVAALQMGAQTQAQAQAVVVNIQPAPPRDVNDRIANGITPPQVEPLGDAMARARESRARVYALEHEGWTPEERREERERIAAAVAERKAQAAAKRAAKAAAKAAKKASAK